MTNKELELRIKNLENAIFSMSRVAHARSSNAEDSIREANERISVTESNVGDKVGHEELASIHAEVEEQNCEILYQLCLLQLGLTEPDIMSVMEGGEE